MKMSGVQAVNEITQKILGQAETSDNLQALIAVSEECLSDAAVEAVH